MGKKKGEAARGKGSEPLHRMYYQSPIGRLCLEDDGEALTALYLVEDLSQDAESQLNMDSGENSELNGDSAVCGESDLLQQACAELEEYFLGTRKEFDILLHPQGTEFQKKVWNALREIPYGQTRSYADIAERIGQPNACRAVGGANNKNRILIMIPCHRVIGKNGSLTGFGCGIDAKEYLLKLEQLPALSKTAAQNREDTVSEAELVFAYDVGAEGEHGQTGKYTLEDYYAIPQERRVELIDGHIYDMAAPGTVHQFAVVQIVFQFELYIRSRGGSCRPYPSPIDVQLDCDDKTMVQPDVIVLCDSDKIKGRCIYGAPDLVVEILSNSTVRKDLTVKLWKYINAGVREYWIVDMEQEKVIVYDMTGEERCISVFGMDCPIPVRIFNGDCRISFDEIREEARRILKPDEKDD